MSDPFRHVTFRCGTQPAVSTQGVVVADTPNGTMAGAEILAAGWTAVDALPGLTMAEPMTVGMPGGGLPHLRLPEGRHMAGHLPDRVGRPVPDLKERDE